MTPTERTMPIIVATWKNGYGWVIALPGNRERLAVDEREARRIVAREAPGSAVDFRR